MLKIGAITGNCLSSEFQPSKVSTKRSTTSDGGGGTGAAGDATAPEDGLTAAPPRQGPNSTETLKLRGHQPLVLAFPLFTSRLLLQYTVF